MSLHPRYSLLTLLVLTALVAGGVMFYRVPRRAIVSDPPTAEEQRHLDENFISDDYFKNIYLLSDGGRLELEYEYLPTCSGQQWRSIVGRPRGKSFLVGLNDQRSDWPDRWVFAPESWTDEQADFFKPGTQLERVHAVVIACENSREKSATAFTAGTTVQLPTFAFRTVGGCPGESCYLLTDQQHIFLMTSTYLMISAEQVLLEQISNAAVRKRVAEELAKLPPAR